MSQELVATMKKAVAALEGARIPYVLGGGYACWALGGPPSSKDVDVMIKREDAARAQAALVEAGMRPEDPPEQWLLKAWDGKNLVDLIFEPLGIRVTDEMIERGEDLNIEGMRVRVMDVDDIITTKLLSIGEHDLPYEQLLQIARALREQINWDEIRARTSHYPYAKAFVVLAEELGLAGGREREAAGGEPAGSGTRVRIT